MLYLTAKLVTQSLTYTTDTQRKKIMFYNSIVKADIRSVIITKPGERTMEHRQTSINKTVFKQCKPLNG